MGMLFEDESLIAKLIQQESWSIEANIFHILMFSASRLLLKQIKNSAEAHIVLDCSTDKIYEVLKQAQQIGMMSDYHSYLITSLDLHTLNLEDFKYGGTNITAFRLINAKTVQDTIKNWGSGNITSVRVGS